MAADKLDNLSFYRRAIETFGLPEDRADKIAAQMAALGVDRDEAYMLMFLATGRIEHVAEEIPAAMREVLNELSATMEKRGKQTVGGVKKAVDDAVASMPERLTGSFDVHMQRISDKLSESVQDTVDREASRRVKLQIGGFALAVAVFIAAAFGGGYVIGRDHINAEAARWASIVDLDEGGQWLALAQLNSIDRALAQSCTAGEGRVVAGGRICDVPLYVSKPVANGEGGNLVRLSIAEWSNKLGVWGLLAAGGIIGFAAGRFRKKDRYA